MTASKSEGELLSELRTQLEETQAEDFETNRASMLALVDQLRKLKFEENQRMGTTIQILENAFLDKVMPGTTLSLEEHAQRFDELENRVSGLNEAGVLWLFSRLEYLAANKIYSLYALAQTVHPAKIKEQCPWLPDSLVHNTDRALKADKIKAGHWKVLNPIEHASFRQECLEWLDRKVRKHGDCGAFDAQMAQKYPRASRKTIERYRLELQMEKTRRASIEGDRD